MHAVNPVPTQELTPGDVIPVADNVVAVSNIDSPAEFHPDSLADRTMRRLLRIRHVDASASTERAAHRNFRTSMIISGIRCLISYLIVPILVPIIGFAGIVAAPIGIALCLVAVVNGIYALRRFWSSNHRMRWMYTWFIAVVFIVLAIAMTSDILRIVASL